MDTAVQTFEPTPEPLPRPSASAPQLRTLLLTDLVDSTGLVERLGDAPASDLFRAHDRLVLQLQQQWRGRLIDRSDGMLLLFERPIDGLGFALDYTCGLIALGGERDIELRARIGLHVGEVLTWRNSEEAVSVGAKPVEVEGLAKPMAARLMATARPGQILLSSVAEPLAHRAARELGERGLHLAWKAWGRWRFKGVPEPQHIFEVGEPGIAPLRMPPDTPKAWRDIPLWRRPAALAVEAALLAGLAVGAWFIAKPEPAIAFNQRDWVVIGDLRNLTGQATLDDSLEQAFRISLEQSRHVNVLSDLKARDTLARMQRAPDTKLDRAIASEIALRDGARAVILPTVAEIGGRVRVSAEVIDPRTQTTVYTETAEGTGVASTLDSIDTVTASLRGKLGEAVKTIEKDSVPLPQVTTKNLDALRAYALAESAYLHGDYKDAQRFYERANALDPAFALAWIGQMRVRYAQADTPAAVAFLRRAQALKENLPVREALYLDAWAARFDSPSSATEKWVELARLYPDYAQVQMNAAMWLFAENRYEDALAYGSSALKSRNALRGIAYDAIGRAQLGLGKYTEAGKAFDRAIADGYRSSLRRRLGVAAASRQFAEASVLEKKLIPGDRYASFERASLAVDQARWLDAVKYAGAALQSAERAGGFDSRNFPVPAATADWMAGNLDGARAKAQLAADRALLSLGSTNNPDAEDDAAVALASSLLALRLGAEDQAKRTLSTLEGRADLMKMSGLVELVAVVRAELLRISGQPQESIRLLQPFVDGNELYQTRSALLSANVDAKSLGAALDHARWLQQNRGRAYTEQTCGYCIQLLNVADSNLATLSEAEILKALGRDAEAAKAFEGFDRRWPIETLPSHLRVRRAKVSASSVGVL